MTIEKLLSQPIMYEQYDECDECDNVTLYPDEQCPNCNRIG
mgnify:CR=1 FL=1